MNLPEIAKFTRPYTRRAEMLCVGIFHLWCISIGAGRGLELRGHTSRGGGAAPQHRIAPLAHKPHPSPDDASGAGYA